MNVEQSAVCCKQQTRIMYNNTAVENAYHNSQNKNEHCTDYRHDGIKIQFRTGEGNPTLMIERWIVGS